MSSFQRPPIAPRPRRPLCPPPDRVITVTARAVRQQPPGLADVATLWRSMVEACVSGVLFPTGCVRHEWRATERADGEIVYSGPWVERLAECLAGEILALEAPTRLVSNDSGGDSGVRGEEIAP